MFHLTRIMLYLASPLIFAACSSTPLVKQPPEWGYEKNAIVLNITSDPRLNLFQKQAHSLIVCLYHLRDPNGFNQLTDEQGGLARLLECGRFDSSVTYSRRLVVQPNQDMTLSLDRTDGAKYIGIVAGYYALQKETSVRTYPIPITEIKRGSILVQQTAQLNIDLHLGPQGIKPAANNQEGKEK